MRNSHDLLQLYVITNPSPDLPNESPSMPRQDMPQDGSLFKSRMINHFDLYLSEKDLYYKYILIFPPYFLKNFCYLSNLGILLLITVIEQDYILTLLSPESKGQEMTSNLLNKVPNYYQFLEALF
jgi:hypothetical protein